MHSIIYYRKNRYLAHDVGVDDDDDDEDDDDDNDDDDNDEDNDDDDLCDFQMQTRF